MKGARVAGCREDSQSPGPAMFGGAGNGAGGGWAAVPTRLHRIMALPAQRFAGLMPEAAPHSAVPIFRGPQLVTLRTAS